jgi:histo-blood group ABO system transferase
MHSNGERMKLMGPLSVVWSALLLSASCLAQEKYARLNVGLLVMATGRYTCFLEKLLTSAEKYFLPNHNRTYFIFTDGQVPALANVVRIEQKRLGWPYDTLMRFGVYLNAEPYFEDIDYLFACDADMVFVDRVGDEILADLVGTKHPGFCLPRQRHDDYERNSASTAYVAPGEGHHYFAGGFYGGSRAEFLKLIFVCYINILQDLAHNIIVQWHDESHLNRYFIDNPPLVLPASYCYPEEGWGLPFAPRLVAVYKNHKDFQTNAD